MAAIDEADYRNWAEIQRRGVAIANAAAQYTGPHPRSHDYAAVRAWLGEHGASIRETAEQSVSKTLTDRPHQGKLFRWCAQHPVNLIQKLPETN